MPIISTTAIATFCDCDTTRTVASLAALNSTRSPSAVIAVTMANRKGSR